MGVIGVGAQMVTDAMMLAASKALSGCVTAEELRDESVLPRIERLRLKTTMMLVEWLPACMVLKPEHRLDAEAVHVPCVGPHLEQSTCMVAKRWFKGAIRLCLPSQGSCKHYLWQECDAGVPTTCSAYTGKWRSRWELQCPWRPCQARLHLILRQTAESR